MLKYFRRTPTLKIFQHKNFSDENSYNENFPIYGTLKIRSNQAILQSIKENVLIGYYFKLVIPIITVNVNITAEYMAMSTLIKINMLESIQLHLPSWQ